MTPNPRLDRRSFLTSAAALGTAGELALHRRLTLAAELGGGHPLAPKPGHFPARAKHLILFFFTGGLSHVDTFDHKPQLNKDHGKTIGSNKRSLKGTDWKFRPYGECGKMVSELFPHVGSVVDDICFLHTVRGDSGGHSAATQGMLTGSITFPMPSIGAWISYGLGTQNTSLPPYVVLAAKEPYNAFLAWDSGFLPGFHKGTRFIPGPDSLPNLASPIASVRRQDLERQMLNDWNQAHLQRHAEAPELRSRITSLQTAQGLMQQAPEALDVAREPRHVLDLYGPDTANPASFAAQCLVARRLVERGVRVVQLFDVGSNTNWDNHRDMKQHENLSRNVDRPIAGLLTDLKRRGLLDETLVVGCTEFGRTPWEDLTPQGRGHYNRNFTCFLAGGGVKGGYSHGVSDEFGATAVEHPMHVHDLHATILHLMGLDHERLTYRYSGRDFRLTDVHGNVATEVIA
ncbi:DUF1501 domain-containing protein [Roseimaritima sediminicola]|uniref:DUF1501 domain-containing protein n=1 Tax=Roseimaritima sediminicola TaxID=2662066 RepID=UPI0012985830|nr:DUF1501 domain-containing protein [Roseimaritima sediminicola]